MKEIKTREEYAKALNFNSYPVLSIDMGQEPKYNCLYEGSKCRVDFGRFKSGERFLDKNYLLYNLQENKFELMGEPTILSSNFTYDNAMEDLEYSTTPIIDEGDEVVIVIYNSKEKTIRAFIAVAKNKKNYCTTTMVFE